MGRASKFFISVLGCIAVGLLSGFFTVSSVANWYQTLNKPFLSPPDWVFGPVWTILYFLMGISLFLVWSKKEKGSGQKLKALAIKVFLIQLGLNFLWSFIFFGQQDISLAAIEIIILLIAIYYTIIQFRKISKQAASLLIPYLLWVTFATYLNIAILILNF